VITVYKAGKSWLHRLPAGPKLLSLTAMLLAISVFGQSPITLAVGAALSAAAFLTAGFGIAGFARQLWAMRWLLLIMLVPGLIFLPWQTALINTTRLVECVLLASVFSFTTKTADLLAALERAANPLRRFGVNPQAIGLVLTMTISSIPLIIKFAGNVREAQLARGVRPNIVRTTIPLLVASLKHSDDFAEALMARGVEV
jgi:biotin transport system permease protein